MARFTTALSHTFRRTRARPDVVRELLPAVEATLDDADACQRGPGWFDSSWDLQRVSRCARDCPAIRSSTSGSRPACAAAPCSTRPRHSHRCQH